MSGVNSLPGGGKDFSTSRFNSKLSYLSKKSSEISPLSDNQKAIMRAVNKYQGAIRRGTFDKSQQNRAIGQIKQAGDLNLSQLKTVKKIINKLADSGEEKVKAPRIRINRADDEDLPGPGLANQSQAHKGSGLSDISSPKEYSSASSRPVDPTLKKSTTIKNLNSRINSSRPPSRPVFR